MDKSCEPTQPQARTIFVNRWLLLPNPTGKALICPAGSTLPHLSVPAVPHGKPRMDSFKYKCETSKQVDQFDCGS